jgi:hypothetical protein
MGHRWELDYQECWQRLRESQKSQEVVAHAFNLRIWEAQVGRFLSLRPAWSTKWVPGQIEDIQRNPVKKQTTKQTNKQKNKTNKQTTTTKESQENQVPAIQPETAWTLTPEITRWWKPKVQIFATENKNTRHDQNPVCPPQQVLKTWTHPKSKIRFKIISHDGGRRFK